MSLELHILIEKEDDLYSAICLELNVASQGRNEKEALRNIKEAVELYFEDVCESGEEKEFIPRPAPVEEWLKYFQQKSKEIKKDIIKNDNLVYSEAVIG